MSVIEAMQLRNFRTKAQETADTLFVKDIARVYGAKPQHEEALLDMLITVFEYGKVCGTRFERYRKGGAVK